ncbi:uncharacterized protein LOC119163284 isoform X2 [Rhipicephalus microplus]|uniref:uncharacterized protein LOC119163284 isoform X2 n=1 Tax=Rhipicephalus microplus TaxID=6941 RepID=UPI003F6C0192
MSHSVFHNTAVEGTFRESIPEASTEVSNQETRDVTRRTSLLTPSDTLSYEKLSDEDAVLLRRTLSARPPIKSIYLGQTSLSSFKIVFTGLEEIPSLREITFGLIDCESEDLDIARCAIFKSLRSLDLSCVKVGRRFGKDVANYIRQSKFLEELRLSLSCGGDEGIAIIIEALTLNDTLKTFTLTRMGPLAELVSFHCEPQLSSDVLNGFAEMLASNSSLELVDVRGVFPVEKDKVSSLLGQERHAGVFKRLFIEWPEQLLPELSELVRQEACYSKLHVIVSSSVDEGELREFFDAVASNKALVELHFSPYHDELDKRWYDDDVEAVAEGILFVLKRTTTLRKIGISVPVHNGHVLSIFDALKENRNIAAVSIHTGGLTDGLMKSLAELLAVNKALDFVSLYDYWGLMPREVRKVLQALRTNYTLTTLFLDCEMDHEDDYFMMREIRSLLDRNVSLMERAAEFVLSGAAVSDKEGADALKKVQASPRLVEKVRYTTGDTEEAAMEAVLSALARVSL